MKNKNITTKTSTKTTTNIYEDNGLRMIGCRKMGFCSKCNRKDTSCTYCDGKGKVDEGRVYKPKSIMSYSGNTDD